MPSGIGQGELVVLREWQRDFIRRVYDPSNEHGKRRVRRALLSIARKNAKTALAAMLVLVHLVGPESKYNGEVYSAATDRHQAGHIYKMAMQMVELNDELKTLCKCLHTTKRIICYHNGSFYQSLSADARRQHGFNPHFVIYDELAQALNRDMWDVLSTSFGAQDEGLLLAISTQSSDAQSIMTELCDDAEAQESGELVDPTFYGKVYTIPDGVDPYDEANWPLANPAIGDFRDLDDMRSLAEKAKRSPTAEAMFFNLNCNRRVDGVQRLVNSSDWKACGKEIDEKDLIGFPCFGALDLSARQDLTAFSLVWELPDAKVATKCWFWTPEDELLERSKRDGALYLDWVQAGHLKTIAGRSVNYGVVVRDIAQLRAKFAVKSIVYDRWRIDEFRRELEVAGENADKWGLIEFGQGFKDMSPAIDRLETLVINHDLSHDANPVLTYCLSNVRVLRDPSGNRKFDKRQATRRIDGAVTMAMAVAAASKSDIVAAKGPSVYETRGIRRL